MTEAGRDHRHRPVPLARAGPRRAGRPELGPLLDGDRALRAAHGRGAVYRREPGRDRDEAPRRRYRRAPSELRHESRTTSTSSSSAPSRRSRPTATGPRPRWTRDLEPVARGGRVAAETAEAATMVLWPASDGARRDRGDPDRRRRRRSRSTTRPERGRSIWPWLLGARARPRTARRRVSRLRG